MEGKKRRTARELKGWEHRPEAKGKEGKADQKERGWTTDRMGREGNMYRKGR